jgi:hypothetical protein
LLQVRILNDDVLHRNVLRHYNFFFNTVLML